MSRNRQLSIGTEDLEISYTPGTNVIARIKGYPAWPAVVVKYSDLSDQVKRAKPARKTTVPVLFYNDSSFLWVTMEEIQPLSREIAEKNSRAKVKKTLKEAYAQAATAPEAYSELRAKLFPVTNGENTPSTAVMSSEPETEPEVEPEVRSRRARSAAERAAEQRAKPRIASSRKRSHEPVTKPGKKTKKEGHSKEAPAVIESDGSDSEYQEISEQTDVSDDWNLESNASARLNLCMSIRNSLYEVLIGFENGAVVDTDRTLGSTAKKMLKQFEEASPIEPAFVRKSKLSRVVLALLKQAKLNQSSLKELEVISRSWNLEAEPVIRGIPEALAVDEHSDSESRDVTPKPEATDDQSNHEIADSDRLVDIEQDAKREPDQNNHTLSSNVVEVTAEQATPVTETEVPERNVPGNELSKDTEGIDAFAPLDTPETKEIITDS